MPSPGGGRDRALAETLLQGVNQARASNGLGTLIEDSALTRAAEAFSEYLALTCPQCDPHHGRPENELLAERRKRLEDAGYVNSWTPGELWIPGFLWTSAQELCRQWVTSALHGAIILRPDLREAGLGCYVRLEEPASAPGETGSQCEDTIDNDGDTWVNDGCAPVVCILYVAPRP